MKDREAWDRFIAIMQAAQKGPADGLVPVALIMCPGGAKGDDYIEVEVETIRMLWPASFPEPERGRLLKRAADAYTRPELIQRIEGRGQGPKR